MKETDQVKSKGEEGLNRSLADLTGVTTIHFACHPGLKSVS